jgi:predicted GIY-YIG superfamily endonuclease
MRAEKRFYVYILASRSRVLYVGTTSRIEARLKEHRNESEGSAAHYRCHRLVLLERYTHPLTAIAREKTAKTMESREEGHAHRANKPAMDRSERRMEPSNTAI